MLCAFVNGVCIRPGCHNANRSGEPDERVRAICRFTCPKLGEPTGEVAEVVCLSCNKTKLTRAYPIHACELFGECLPAYECTRESKESLAEWMEKRGRITELQTCRGCPYALPE